MPAATDNPAFKQPSNPSIKIWRYMDFTKYVSILDSGSLFFARADLLGDPYEGSSSRANIALRPDLYREVAEQTESMSVNQVPVMLEQLSKLLELARRWVYINSWHMNENESAAMWDLYAVNRQEAITIQSTYAKLRDCLPSEVDTGDDNPKRVYVSEVMYIDYETDWLPEGSFFYPVTHKRKSFEHERELRALFLNAPDDPLDVNTLKEGQLVGVSLDALIEAVYVAPTAPPWFRDLVEAVSSKYDLMDKPIVRSSLGADPVY